MTRRGGRSLLEGNIEIVRIIILQTEQAKELLKEKDASGKTPLHLAAENGKAEIVEFILQSEHFTRELLEIKDHNGYTPPYLAALNGHLSVVNVFLKSKHKKIILIQNDDKSTPLHAAVIEGRNQVIIAILESEDAQEVVSVRNIYGNTAFHIAALKGPLSVISTFLKSKHAEKIMMAQNLDGYTALHIAAMQGRVDVAIAILESKYAKELLETKDANGDTPLQTDKIPPDFWHSILCDAIKKGNLELAKAIILQSKESKAILEIENTRKNTPLHLAVEMGRVEIVKVFLQSEHAKELLRAQNWKFNTPLHRAAEMGRVEIVKVILQSEHAKELLATRNNEGFLPLHTAIIEGRNEVVIAILESEDAKEVVNIRDINRNTAFHIAASKGRPDAVSAFLESKYAEEAVMAKDREGYTALHLDAIEERPDIAITILESKYAKKLLETKNNNGDTPLQDDKIPPRFWHSILCDAIKKGNSELAKAIILQSKKSKEILEIKDFNRDTLFDFAVKMGKTEIAEVIISVLIDKGANIQIKINLALETKNYNSLAFFINRDVREESRENRPDTIKQTIAYLANHNELKSLVELQRNLSEESKLKLSAGLLQWFEQEKDNLDIGVFRTVAEISQIFKGGAEGSAANIEASRLETPSSRGASGFSFAPATSSPNATSQPDSVTVQRGNAARLGGEGPSQPSQKRGF